MRIAAPSLVALLAAPALAQEVVDCNPVPRVTALVEPWEETSAVLGDGAVRVALLEDQAGQGLLVLTLPTIEAVEAAEGEAEPGGLPPLPERRCRIVAEGGIGFALIDVAGIEAAEDPVAATLTARVPALRFIAESSELEEVTLVLTFGLADGSLEAEVEESEAEEPEEADGAVEPEEALEGQAEPEETGEVPEPEEEAADAP